MQSRGQDTYHHRAMTTRPRRVTKLMLTQHFPPVCMRSPSQDSQRQHISQQLNRALGTNLPRVMTTNLLQDTVRRRTQPFLARNIRQPCPPSTWSPQKPAWATSHPRVTTINHHGAMRPLRIQHSQNTAPAPTTIFHPASPRELLSQFYSVRSFLGFLASLENSV